MENCLERMERIDAKRKIADFMIKEQMPYDFKIRYATVRAREFVRECDKRELNYHVSGGGLDSITLKKSRVMTGQRNTTAFRFWGSWPLRAGVEQKA